MRGFVSIGVVLLAFTAPAVAQPGADATVASVRGTFDMARGWLTKAAEQVPEEHYSFKPTPDVRSLGAILGHVADANFAICGAASGEKAPMSGVEKSKTTKKDLTDALAQSFKFCQAAFDGLGARGNETVKFFLPGTHTRLGVLAFNNAHDMEHYGNIVTYMRLKGLVPPSSAPGTGQD